MLITTFVIVYVHFYFVYTSLYNCSSILKEKHPTTQSSILKQLQIRCKFGDICYLTSDVANKSEQI